MYHLYTVRLFINGKLLITRGSLPKDYKNILIRQWMKDYSEKGNTVYVVIQPFEYNTSTEKRVTYQKRLSKVKD